MNPSFPANWTAGFQGDLQVGANGTERPFLAHGRWKLRVFERSTGKHFLYDYSTDLLEEAN